MSLLEWKQEYSVGVAAMDDEHREMMDLINDIYAKLASDPDADQVDECLGDIYNTISLHFALEEKLMRNNRYSEYAAHKDDHEVLLDQIRDLMDDYHDDPQSGSGRLAEGLADWFVTHFSTFDARLHGALGD
jgi:hemerythrin